MTERHLKTSLPRLLTLGAMAWFVLWACAPKMIGPPARSLPEAGTNELGASLNLGTAEDWQSGQKSIEDWQGAALYFRRQIANKPYTLLGQEFTLKVESGAALAGVVRPPEPLAFSPILFSRMHLDAGRLGVGYQVQTSGLDGTASLPLELRVTDAIWITTNPGASIYPMGLLFIPGYWSTSYVPIGMSLRLGAFYIDAEAGKYRRDYSGGYGIPISGVYGRLNAAASF